MGKLLDRATFDNAMQEATTAWGATFTWPKAEALKSTFDLWFKVLERERYQEAEFLYCFMRALAVEKKVENLPAVLSPYRDSWAASQVEATPYRVPPRGEPYDNEYGQRAFKLMRLILDDYEISHELADDYINGRVKELPPLQFNAERRARDANLQERRAQILAGEKREEKHD